MFIKKRSLTLNLQGWARMSQVAGAQCGFRHHLIYLAWFLHNF